MCIICKIKQAGISEEALEMVESLAGRVMFEQRVAQEGEAEEAPEGLPVEVWQAMPPELREIIRGAITKGAKLQVVSLSDMMADESITKH